VTDIPLNACVECADGPCGQSTYVIINPVTQQVTHVVVKEKGFRHTDHLVPMDLVVETTPHLIRLRYTKDELAKIEPFIETHHVQGERPRFEDVPYFWPFPVPKETMTIPVEHARIPSGELAVHRGALVKATDGHVGRVDEFLVDPANGHITHLVLQEGPWWGQKDVTIPVSGIDHIEENTVHLKLDKHTITGR
jgi:sporulation protein YlmC with PRC-barrel domain